MLCHRDVEIVGMCSFSLQDAGMYTLHNCLLLFHVVPASFCIRKGCVVLDFLLHFSSTDHSK